MKEVVAMGKVPIFVGGSGYYINGLINGFSPIPEVCDENRAKAREMVENNPNAVRKLLPDDFVPTDPQRTARALEVFLETGKHLNEWQKLPRRGALPGYGYKILISPNREILLERIARRVPEMMRGDALDEAKNIIAHNLPTDRAIGADQICKMLRGEISEQRAIENWILKTNQYAKRQRTWYKTQYVADYEITHVPTSDDLDDVIEKLA
jgi:tRNA dimethylallyltransferase